MEAAVEAAEAPKKKALHPRGGSAAALEVQHQLAD